MSSQPPKAQIHILPFLVEKMETRKEVLQKLREYQVTYSTSKSGHTYSKTSFSQNCERFENLKSTKSTTKSAYTYSVEKMKSRKQKIARNSKMSSQPSQPLKAHVHIRKKALQKFQEYQVTYSTSKSDDQNKGRLAAPKFQLVKKLYRNFKSIKSPSQCAKATIHIRKQALHILSRK